MPVITLVPLLADFYADQVIDASHFGANLIFDRDRFEPSPEGPAGTYGTALNMLGVTTIRYPGGTITELVFDLANPNATTPAFELVPTYRLFDPDRHGPLQPSLLGLDMALHQAGQQGLDMTFVMPTLRFLGTATDATSNRSAVVDEPLVHAFTLALLAESLANGVRLTAIELGNEWWVDHSNLLGGTRMSAIEYGRIASSLAVVIQDAINDFRAGLPATTAWAEPDIVVQVGPGGLAEMVLPNGRRPPVGYDGPLVSATKLIFEQFDRPVEQEAIDGLVTHRYQTHGLHNINGWAYEPFDIWESLVANNPNFGELDRYVTEWNVAARNAEYAGLRQAGALVALFSEMIVAGVDHANIWSVQQNNDTRLTNNVGWNGDMTVGLSVAGEMFRMLNASTQGMQAIPLAHSSTSFSTRAFGDDSSLVLYISNLEASAEWVTFDLASIADRVLFVEGRALMLTGGDPLDNEATPLIRDISNLVFTLPSTVGFTLGAYQTAEITVTLGQASLESAGLGEPERVFGSPEVDHLHGFAGNDTLFGFAGSDTLVGGLGDDVLHGDGHFDTLFGGEGRDTLFGGHGNDVLFGGSGDDRLVGGPGADIMYGGLGNDRYVVDSTADRVVGELGYGVGGGIDVVESSASYTLPTNVEVLHLIGTENISGTGTGGHDLIIGNAGNNTLSGGYGNDRINGKEGDDWIIGGHGADTLVGDAGRDTFVYLSASESRAGPANRDFINGFERGVDRIDVSAIDARPGGADDAFRFMGRAAFSGNGADSAGELRYFTFGSGNHAIVEADLNGDGVAEFQLFVNQCRWLTATDFVL